MKNSFENFRKPFKSENVEWIFAYLLSCKKIRDDKGYWEQVEVYIRDHSEAEFTHGICPDCMKKLYPDEI